MSGLHCGIDIGSTNLKVVFLDEAVRVVFSTSVASPRVADGAAIATDALALLQTLEEIIMAGWRAHGRGLPLRSLSTSGVGEDGMGVDGALQPLGFAIPWFDMRAEAEAAELRRCETPRTGIRMGAELTGAKWLWTQRHRPSEISAAAHWITLTDFPLVQWSGVPFMSLSLAPRTGCYDVYGRNWLDNLLQQAAAPPLPPVMPAGHIVGTMRPGPLRASGAADANTALVAGGHDHPMAAAALRRLNPNARVDSIGTANLVYGETRAAFDPVLRDTISFSLPARGTPGLACLGVVLDFAALMQKAGADTQRAIEETAQRSRQMFIEMDQLGVPPGPIYMTGGWSRSRELAELRATVFGEPVHVIADLDLPAVSAALNAIEAVTGQAPDVTGLLRPEQIDPFNTL